MRRSIHSIHLYRANYKLYKLLSLSESRLKQASRDIKQPKQSNSRSANSKSSHKENVTVPLSRGDGDISEQRSSAGTSSENSTNEHVNS